MSEKRGKAGVTRCCGSGRDRNIATVGSSERPGKNGVIADVGHCTAVDGERTRAVVLSEHSRRAGAVRRNCTATDVDTADGAEGTAADTRSIGAGNRAGTDNHVTDGADALPDHAEAVRRDDVAGRDADVVAVDENTGGPRGNVTGNHRGVGRRNHLNRAICCHQIARNDVDQTRLTIRLNSAARSARGGDVAGSQRQIGAAVRPHPERARAGSRDVANRNVRGLADIVKQYPIGTNPAGGANVNRRDA